MPVRDLATPGRRASQRVRRVLNPDGSPAAPAVDARPRRSAAARRDAPASGTTARGGLTATELARAAWHAFPGFLALFLVREVFPDEPHRTWRAHVVARALAPFLVACWIVEWARLSAGILPTVAHRAFAAILRPSERHGVHGTAWYLLGVCIALSAYPADAAVLAIAHLAWCDPAASVVGRALGDVPWLGGGKRFASGKSWIGTLACAATGAAVTYALFAPGGTFAAREDAAAAAAAAAAATSGWRGKSIPSTAIVSDHSTDPHRLLALAIVGGLTTALVELFGSPAAKGAAKGAEKDAEKGAEDGVRAAIDAYKSRRRSARKEPAGSVGFVRVALSGAANDNFLIPIITGGVMWGARVALLG